MKNYQQKFFKFIGVAFFVMAVILATLFTAIDANELGGVYGK